MSVQLYKFSDLPEDIQKKVYEEYLKDSRMVDGEDVTIENFADDVDSYLGKAYMKDGTCLY